MKKFVVFWLLCMPLFVFSQTNMELSGYGKVGADIRSNLMYGGGVQYEWQPKYSKWGLNYSLRFMRNFDGDFEFQCPLGAITGIFGAALISSNNDIDLSGLGLLLCFIPEGVSYNISLSDDFKIAPYVNPLLFSVSADKVSFDLEAGAKIKCFFTEHFMGAIDLSLFSPYDYAKIYTYGGISLGWAF